MERTLWRLVALGAAGMTGVFLVSTRAAARPFLGVQGRLDVREAKLATAPIDPEVLEFR
ncbi:MAG: hypothetical protein ACRDY6_21460 [Acidimicrobiia bacterium]